jgi:hypothetical protein
MAFFFSSLTAVPCSCVVCAVFRFIYISTVDLTNNITGTMPTTVLLFILEPNLSILCVSIPMLRPVLKRFRKQIGLSSGSHDQKSQYGYGSRSGNTKLASGSNEASSWELGNYYPRGKGKNKVDITRADDESGSEKNLTEPAKPVIRVNTAWSVSHS